MAIIVEHSIPIWRARSNLAATRVRQKLFLPFGSSPRRSLMVQCAMVQEHPETPRVSPCYLSFFGYVSPCTTPDLAAGCPIQAFVMNRRLMGERGGRKKKRKENRRKKKYCTDPYFGISTAQHIRVEFLKNIKKKREEIKGTITRNPSKRYPYPLIPRWRISFRSHYLP